jgi:hypothetical protein
MERLRHILNLGVLCFALTASVRADDLPATSNVVARVLERAELVAKGNEATHYAYQKRTVTAELDEKDKVVKSTEKTFNVVLINGVPFSRLVKVQGKELTGKELEKQNQREIAFRQKVTGVDLKKKAARREGMATPELVARFDFNVLKRELIEGRPTLVLSFAPHQPLAAEKTIEDKVLNRISGTLWVDEAEAEVTKVDASVRGPIPLGWWAMVGALNRCQFSFQRNRLPDGVWVNTKGSFEMAGRKLISAMHIRSTEESTGFRRE